MLGVPLLLTALLLPVTLQNSSAGVRDLNLCTEGWFGQNCMYKCRCEHSSVCGSDGTCPAGAKCLEGFFGPGCQYVNLAFSSEGTSTPSYLHDNDVATCNPDPDSIYVEFSLATPVTFQWIRIVVNDDGSRLQFSFKINSNSDCDNERRFIVSSTTVDITCHMLNMLHSFSVTGRTAATICEVYISGGRNVALKQETHSSSSWDDTTGSHQAVDGQISGRDPIDKCAVTTMEPFPSWQLIYSTEKIISRVVIYLKQAGACTSRNFRLTMLDASNQTVDTYEASGSRDSLVYDILVVNDNPVKIVNISVPSSAHGICRQLSLCEVETYGETFCPDNKYGLWCGRNCECTPGDVCHIATGACAFACKSGFYGGNCTKPCPAKCLNQTCYHRQGACVHCNPGHKGHFCDTDCETGHFGMDCAWTCSKKCLTPCDHVSGACTCAKGFGGTRCDECQPGYFGEDCTKKCSSHCTNPCDYKTGHCFCDQSSVGLFCNECVSGMYGDNCTLKCSQNCQERLCYHDTGYCHSCIGDHIGLFCEGCPPKYYGHLCRFKCSSQCLNETCDEINGTCPECLSDYGGPQCIIAPKDTSKIYWFIVPAMLPTSMLVFSAIHFIRKKRELEKSEEDFSITDASRGSASSEV